jgi:hypothetical protein
MEQKTIGRHSVQRSVTGATPGAAAGNLAGPAFSQAAMFVCSSSAGPTGRNGEQRQPLTRVAKPHELRAVRSNRCEESIRW